MWQSHKKRIENYHHIVTLFHVACVIILDWHGLLIAAGKCKFSFDEFYRNKVVFRNDFVLHKINQAIKISAAFKLAFYG